MIYFNFIRCLICKVSLLCILAFLVYFQHLPGAKCEVAIITNNALRYNSAANKICQEKNYIFNFKTLDKEESWCRGLE